MRYRPECATEFRRALPRLCGTFFGAVFFALVSSLPEVVTTYEASRRNADDQAVDLCYEAPLFAVLSNGQAVAALGIIITTTVATMRLLYHAEKRIWFMEPDAVGVIGITLLFFYLPYIV